MPYGSWVGVATRWWGLTGLWTQRKQGEGYSYQVVGLRSLVYPEEACKVSSLSEWGVGVATKW